MKGKEREGERKKGERECDVMLLTGWAGGHCDGEESDIVSCALGALGCRQDLR